MPPRSAVGEALETKLPTSVAYGQDIDRVRRNAVQDSEPLVLDLPYLRAPDLWNHSALFWERG